jgi:hypothetical protein
MPHAETGSASFLAWAVVAIPFDAAAEMARAA